MTALLGAAELLARGREWWRGTFIALFQPAEETAAGAAKMIKAGLGELIPYPDVAFAQHVLPLPAGTIGTRAGPIFSTADSVRITVHGRGSHGAMPQNGVDTVVLASMIVLGLQTIVSRETAPGERVVVTTRSIMAGTRSNIIPDTAVLLLSVRTYDQAVRTRTLTAIERVVRAECAASGAPRDPEFESYEQFPLTYNDAATTNRVARAFAAHFGNNAVELAPLTASEDFSEIPNALNFPYTYWGVGGIDPDAFQTATASGRLAEDVPVNHSQRFAPVYAADASNCYGGTGCGGVRALRRRVNAPFAKASGNGWTRQPRERAGTALAMTDQW